MTSTQAKGKRRERESEREREGILRILAEHNWHAIDVDPYHGKVRVQQSMSLFPQSRSIIAKRLQ